MKYLLISFFTLAIHILLVGQVSIQTKIPPIVPNSDITIEVKINKGTISNFAKYQVDVPAGVYLSEGDNKTGSFSFENNRAKIIWVSIPTEPEFTITFRLNPGTATGLGTINQKFYYLEDGNRKEIEAMPINVNFSGNTAVISTNISEGEPASTSPELSQSQITPESSASSENPPARNTIVENLSGNAVVENTKASEPRKEKTNLEPTKTTEEVTTKNVSETPAVSAESPETKPILAKPIGVANGLTYKVQIGAYGENPGKARYASLKDVKIVAEDSFYKVIVGNFTSREEAVTRKEELLAKGFKGFIVTFQNGSRIK